MVKRTRATVTSMITRIKAQSRRADLTGSNTARRITKRRVRRTNDSLNGTVVLDMMAVHDGLSLLTLGVRRLMRLLERSYFSTIPNLFPNESEKHRRRSSVGQLDSLRSFTFSPRGMRVLLSRRPEAQSLHLEHRVILDTLLIIFRHT